MKKCPFCAEEIQDAAVLCRHCGSDLARNHKTASKKSRNIELVGASRHTRNQAIVFTMIVGTLIVLAVGVTYWQEPARAPAARASAASPTAALLVGCQPHIEIHSAERWAQELGQPVANVLHSHRINLWSGSGSNRGVVVGKLIPGSRAVILEEDADAYRVRSPLDGSVGWISKVQVARTLSQDVESREPC